MSDTLGSRLNTKLRERGDIEITDMFRFIMLLRTLMSVWSTGNCMSSVAIVCLFRRNATTVFLIS